MQKKNCPEPGCLKHLDEGVKEELDEEDISLVRDVDLTPCGLQNLGATCYLNCNLQSLFMNRKFRNILYRWRSALPEAEQPQEVCSQLQNLFAHMQYGMAKFYTPKDLIDSLKISEVVQQDVQEFSSLFLSHLGQTFSKSKEEDVKKFIQTEFCGKINNTVVCNQCGGVNETKSDFAELVLHMHGKKTLEECLAHFLSEEKLCGENKYQCKACAGLTDATTKMNFVELPPTLNVQLLRFYFNLDLNQKQKSLSQLDIPSEWTLTCVENGNEVEVTYHLTSVLLHLGATPYGGHYIAHLLDPSQNIWFEFDDLDVEELDECEVGDVRNENKPNKNNNNNNNKENAKENNTTKNANNNNTIKNATNNSVSNQNNNVKKTNDFRFKSKNSYMLVYTRRAEKDQSSAKKQNKKAKLKENRVLNALASALPQQVKDQVEESNKVLLELNDQTQYRITSVNEARRIDHDRFAQFLKCADPPIDKYCWITTEWLMNFAQLKPTPISNENLLCPHGHLRINVVENNKNPLNNFKNNVPMKRISHEAYDLINDWYGGGPSLDENRFCNECVSARSEDKEKEKNSKELFAQMKMEYNSCIYNSVHTRKVLTHYASAPFLTKWNVSNLKDTDTNVNKELTCEHGFLKPVDHKAKISDQLWKYLSEQYPESRAFPTTEVDCHQCSQVKRENFLQDENLKSTKLDEKNNYFDVFKKQHLFPSCLKPDRTYYMIPKDWATVWKKYVGSVVAPHPGEIDNQHFVTFSDSHAIENAEDVTMDQLKTSTSNISSSHDDLPPMFLAFDPVEDANHFYIIEEKDWNGLHAIYGGGPAITIVKSGQKFITSPPFNDDIINQRKIRDSDRETSFTNGTVAVQYKVKGKKGGVATRNLKVKTNADTLVDTFKLQIFEIAEIDPVCQTLFFNKTKLENHKTLAFYQIKENSIVVLEIGEGNDDATWTDVFNVHENSYEEGFKGSVLHDSGSLSSSNSLQNTKNNSAQDSPSSSLPKSPARSNTNNNSPSNTNNNNNKNNYNNNKNNAKNNSSEPLFWACGMCTVHNTDLKANSCDTCGTPRQQTKAKVADVWKCGFCTLENDLKETKCVACDKPRKK
jgi:ubiquitin C-terminal hydrolase